MATAAPSVARPKVGWSDMPTTSPKQRKLMLAAAHNKAFAKKVGVPVKVAKKFVAEDKKAKK